jgi:5'-nucleotidase (lipoprotein e(P4) family)
MGALAPNTQAQQSKAENDNLENAILWQQSSGERRALSYQTFALARMLLDRDLQNRRARKRRAVIVDIDETILDNSPYQARLVKEREIYPQGWTAWINRAEAGTVPGALEFLRYAASRRVRVFYVTNRKPIEKEGTAKNLKLLGFPEVTDETLLVAPATGSSSKEPRRKTISARYHVAVFEESKTVDSRIIAVDMNKPKFGTRFLVLPNPMYGNWENSIYEYNFKLSEKEKAAIRKKLLRAY